MLLYREQLINVERKISQTGQIVIAAPGPSLSTEQIELLKKTPSAVLTIGDVGRVALPDADMLYHCDKNWWNYYEGCKDFSGVRISMEQVGYGVSQVARSKMTEGLDFTFPNLVTGNNSGYQAINLAVHFTPKEIILVGYDMKDAVDGRHNIIGDHPRPIKRGSAFPLFIQNIGTLTKTLDNLGISVYNCTIDTALHCFPRKELADVLRAQS